LKVPVQKIISYLSFSTSPIIILMIIYWPIPAKIISACLK